MMCLTFIQVPINVDATENSDLAIKTSEAVYVKIRYNRPDNNYDGWNLWVWEAGKDGKRVDAVKIVNYLFYQIYNITPCDS